MRELSSLIDMQVIATDEGKRLGTISQTLVDLAAGELVAVLLAGPPGKSLVAANDFQVIGDDALMVSDSEVLKSKSEIEEDLARSRDVLANPPTVMTDQGTVLGELAGVTLDDDGRTVLRYGLTGGPLRDVATGATSLPILKDTVHGQDTIIVPHRAAHEYLAKASRGLKGNLDKLASVFRAKYEEISERSEELYHESEDRLREDEEISERSEELYHESEDRLREGTAKARERADELVEQARKKVQEATEHDDEEPEQSEKSDIEAAKEELQAAKSSDDETSDDASADASAADGAGDENAEQ
jgi:uncharacterized protein YrrD